tara:strand:- start:55383 stop:55565 length:183 start_codon:yes stop_codon:yes gene_type:complete
MDGVNRNARRYQMAEWCNMNMEGMGWMMWGMGFFWILVIALLVLGVAALVKYLFSGPRKG